MELNDIAEDEVKRWCDWRNWVAVEYTKHLSQYREWYLWESKLFREEHWPWWARLWICFSGKEPQRPKVCDCVLSALADSFCTRPYYTDLICPLHAQLFGLRRCYSESAVFWLVKTSKKLGLTLRQPEGEDDGN